MKNIIILVSLVLSPWVAHATTQASMQSGAILDLVANCRIETDSLKRLTCYDGVAEKIVKQKIIAQDIQAPVPIKEVSPPPTPAPTTSQKAQVAEASMSTKPSESESEKINQFGMEHKIAQENAEDKIYALATSIRKGPFGKITVILDNGQSWKQIDSGRIRLKEGERVYVERGALNSFFLSKDDVNRRVRVKRIK